MGRKRKTSNVAPPGGGPPLAGPSTAPDRAIPRIVQLAGRVREDIRHRGLGPGAPYLTTAQTARMLGVSTTIANRALQLLAQEGYLDRRQRRGTFVALPESRPGESAIARIHLLVHQHYLKTEGLLADGVIVGLQRELPGADVTFNFMPPGGEAGYADTLIRSIMQSGRREGLVLVRAGIEVQRLAAQSGLPAVVYGTPSRAALGLPFVDTDQAAIGRLLARDALARRCRRILVLMRDQVLPGDHTFLDAVCETAGEAGLAAGSVRIRCIPRDGELAADEVRSFLGRRRPRPAVLCRDEPLAQAVLEELGRLGLRAGADVSVSLSTIYRRGNESPPPVPHARHTQSPAEIGQHLGRLLVACTSERTAQPQSVILPVVLQEARRETAVPDSRGLG